MSAIQRQQTISSVMYSSETTDPLKKRRYSEASAIKTIPFKRNFMERQEAICDSDIYEPSSFEREFHSEDLKIRTDLPSSYTPEYCSPLSPTATGEQAGIGPSVPDTISTRMSSKDYKIIKMPTEELSASLGSYQALAKSTTTDLTGTKRRKIGLAGPSATSVQTKSTPPLTHRPPAERKRPIQYIKPRPYETHLLPSTESQQDESMAASSDQAQPSEHSIMLSDDDVVEGTKRFLVDKFTVTFTEKDDKEEDTLI